MNILYISPSPISHLHRIRSLDLLRCMSVNHKIHLLCLAAGDQHMPAPIGRYCTSVTIVAKTHLASIGSCLNSLFGTDPYEVAYCRSDKMKTLAAHIVKKYSINLIYVKRLRSLDCIKVMANRIPTVIDTTDAMSLFYRRALFSGDHLRKPLYLHEWLAYKKFELNAFKKFKHWITCSSIDQSYLKELSQSQATIHVVPNGVDTQTYHPMKVREAPFTIVFRGLMDKLVNIDAAMYFTQKILPQIRKEIPCVRLTILGPNPSPSIRRLSKYPSVTVTGYVDNMNLYLGRASVVVCPVRIGTGTRYKILQSWAMGKAVVSTALGADGLRADHMKNIVLASDPDKFAQAVILLLKNKKLAKSIGNSGRKTVDKYYDLRVIQKKLDAILERVVSDTL